MRWTDQVDQEQETTKPMRTPGQERVVLRNKLLTPNLTCNGDVGGQIEGTPHRVNRGTNLLAHVNRPPTRRTMKELESEEYTWSPMTLE